MRARLIRLWALGGIAAMFLEAIVRLGARALDLLLAGVSLPVAAAFAGSVGLFAYVEGYRALQRRFAPEVVARIELIAAEPITALTLLAPLDALGLVRPGRRARAWLAVALIVAAVFVVRALPSPWREAVDAGVCVALGWGLVALVVRFVTASRTPAVRS